MLRLSLLGWTQKEIGELVGLEQRTVSDVVGDSGKFNEFNSPLKSDFYDKRKPIEEIAEEAAAAMAEGLRAPCKALGGVQPPPWWEADALAKIRCEGTSQRRALLW